MIQRSILLAVLVGAMVIAVFLTLEPSRPGPLASTIRIEETVASPPVLAPRSVTKLYDDTPAAERLRPGQPLGDGEAFTTRTRLGQKVTGTIFVAQAKRTSVLVVMPGPLEPSSSWRPLLNALRSTRDYHIVVVAPPTEPWRWAERLESIAAVGAMEAAVSVGLDRLRADAVVLMASGESACAAAVLASQRRDVLALALIDAKLIGPMSRWEPVLDALQDRQSWWLVGNQQAQLLSQLRSRRPFASVVVKRGSDDGMEFLNQAKRVSSGLAGWLFAITPSVIEPLRQNED